LLNALVEAIRRYVPGGGKVHGDDTPLPVLAPGNGRTKAGRFWVYVRDDRNRASSEAPALWFAFSPDRGGEHPQAYLKDFKGLLQADTFSGFARLYQDGCI
jgi:transposase